MVGLSWQQLVLFHGQARPSAMHRTARFDHFSLTNVSLVKEPFCKVLEI